MTKLATAFGWEVQERELVLGNQFGKEMDIDNISMQEVPNFKAIVNGATGEVLNVPKQGYSPLLNTELEEAAHMMAKVSNGSVEGFETFQGGRKVLAFIKAKNHTGMINGNEINDYIVIGNSHDGSSSIFMGTSTTLIRCANQFASIQRDLSIRHSGEISLRFEEAINHYKTYYNQRDFMYEKFEEMSKIKIDKKIIESLSDRLFDVDRVEIISGKSEISTRKQNQLDHFKGSLDREMTDLGSNLWGFFNAVTHYSTHVRGGEKSISEKNNSFGNVVGSNANFNEKANKIITKQLAMS